jgi:hypothetical protein
MTTTTPSKSLAGEAAQVMRAIGSFACIEK